MQSLYAMPLEVQNLGIISVSIWQILISLCNLLILFLIIKKFLFKPVKNVLEKRKAEIDAEYEEAAKTQQTADQNKKEYEQKLSTAKEKADDIVRSAEESAVRRGDKIVAEAQQKAEDIHRRALLEIDLEKKRASEAIKVEIADVSTRISEKILQREITAQDHADLVESFIKEIGESDENS